MAFELQASTQGPRVEASSQRVEAMTQGARILLAEDDDELRQLLASSLRRDGHLVEEAINGMDLLAKAGRSLLGCGGSPIDLVITDVCMPGFTGLEVLAALHETAPGLRVIVITAFGSRETHDEAERLGASAFFDKPLDTTELRATVRRLTTRKA
jgi:DNA-binding NtrC family response regulator